MFRYVRYEARSGKNQKVATRQRCTSRFIHYLVQRYLYDEQIDHDHRIHIHI